MNLLDSMMEPFALLQRSEEADDLGGHGGEWTEAATFEAMIRKERSPQTNTAQKPESAEGLTVVVRSATALKYHDVIRRASDGAVFRLTANTRDDAAPAMATIGIAKAACERWELP